MYKFLIIFAFSSWFPLSLIVASLIGLALGTYDPSMNTSIQLRSSDSMRGRVLGLFNLTFGFTPMGGFLAGIVATALNPSVAIGFGGLVIIAGVGFVLMPTRSLWGTTYGPIPSTIGTGQHDR